MTTCCFHYKKSESTNMFCNVRINHPELACLSLPFPMSCLPHIFTIKLITVFPSGVSSLFCAVSRGGKFTVIDHSPVSELRAENCRVKLHSLQKNLFRVHMSHKALLLRTDTQ